MSKEELMMKLLTAAPDVLERVAGILENKLVTPNTSADRRLLTFSKAAETMGVSRQTVWRMVSDGRLTTVEIRPGTRRIPSAALTALLNGGKA